MKVKIKERNEVFGTKGNFWKLVNEEAQTNQAISVNQVFFLVKAFGC